MKTHLKTFNVPMADFHNGLAFDDHRIVPGAILVKDLIYRYTVISVVNDVALFIYHSPGQVPRILRFSRRDVQLFGTLSFITHIMVPT